MMGMKSDIQLIKDGKRLDGRKPNELRDITIKAGVLDNADGSCYLEWGGNKVLAGVYGPKQCLPRHLSNPYKAVLNYRYNMAPFSVDDRKRPGPDRRSVEISKISAEALERVVLLEKFPETMVDVYVEILQAEAGTRCAALTAASVALADAGLPMKDMVTAVAAGKIDGTVVLDLNKAEDNFGQADVPMAVLQHSGEIVLLQMDGDLTQKEFHQAATMAIEASKKVYELQKAALKDKYKERGSK